MTALGIGVGILVAVGASGALGSLLYGVSSSSPVLYLAVGLTLGTVALAATALPARRAASIDPVRSLRSE
jgi:ABC-type antimicrobial peptide transport system permease subunit